MNAVPLFEVRRGALVESVHRGHLVAITGRGEIVAQLGNAALVTYYRSAAKPFQAIPLVAAGAADHYQFTVAELAVINGSHSGETIHCQTVQSILSKIGCHERDLQCGAHMPFDSAAAKVLRTAGQPPQSLHNNCSGKHAGMLALAQFLGHSLDDYLNPEHPVQQLIHASVAQFANVPAASIGIAIDGCSAPVFATSLTAMAHSYARLVAAPQLASEASMDSPTRDAAQRIVDAFIQHPEMIGGTRNRLDTDLMRVARGQLISKVGAEGVQLLGVLPCERYPHGLGIAIKIEDGDIKRARDPVVLETLRQLNVLNDEQCAQLASYAPTAVTNHRQLVVGAMRPCFHLSI